MPPSTAEQAADALDRARRAWAAVSDGRDGTARVARELRDQAAAARALLPEVERAAGLEREIAALGRRIAALDEACAPPSPRRTRGPRAWPTRSAGSPMRRPRRRASPGCAPRSRRRRRR